MEDIKDCVCGVTLPANSAFRTNYEGTTYYFCSEDCLDQFQAEPHRFVKAGAQN